MLFRSLLILPLVLGMLTALITVGRLITKYGRYKIFPIVGTLITAFGVFLFTHISINSSVLQLSLWMIVVGIGVGSFFQVMTLAVQNAIPRSELGVATASATFFRSMGSALGGAIFGAILTNRIAFYLKQQLPNLAKSKVHINYSAIENGTANNIKNYPPHIAHGILQSFTLAFQDMFKYAIPVLLLAFVVSLFLKEIPLRDTAQGSEEI